MTKKTRFTKKGFTLTYVFVFLGFLLLTATIANFALLPDAPFEVDMVTFSLLYVFIAHLVGWSIAYTRYFQVPQGQRVLWVGGLISAIAFSLFQPIYSYVENFPDGLKLTSSLLEFIGEALLITPFMWLQLLITAIYWRLLIMLWNLLVSIARKLAAIVSRGTKSLP